MSRNDRASGYRVDPSLPAPSGRTPLRDHTYARPANAKSFGDYVSHQEIGDIVLAENERIVCVERLTTQTIEQPIVVGEERLQEKSVSVPKPVQRKTVTERPVIQPLRKPVQIIREVCVVVTAHYLTDNRNGIVALGSPVLNTGSKKGLSCLSNVGVCIRAIQVPVERIIKKPYTRKVYIERIIEQVSGHV